MYGLLIGTKIGDLKWRNGRYGMLHYFFIILNHGCAVLLAIAELLVSNLHTAVARILSISSAFLFSYSLNLINL